MSLLPLTERLRNQAKFPTINSPGIIEDCNEAADEIERLEDRLRTARGGCKILSQGDQCDCGLCKRERERDEARIAAVEYRQSWSYCAFRELIEPSREELTRFPWLKIMAIKAGGGE